MNNFIETRKVEIFHSVKDKNELYARVYLDDLNNALRILSPNAFKLWMFYYKNESRFVFNLSQKNILRALNMTKNTYYKCFNELIDKKVIKKTKDGYVFRDHMLDDIDI